MEFKGTKGKWYIGEHREMGIQIGCNQSHYVACAYSGGSDRNYDEMSANAQLISAAPELLAACQEFVRKCECGEARSKRSYSQMKEAIAKALGKEADD